MKAVLTHRADPTLIDISHEVLRHDIRMGAFLLYSAAPHFPAGTVHLAVVDPGVGTERKPLIMTSGGHYFVGPDNGLLMPAARRLGGPTVFEITDPPSLRPGISTTFQGRDVFAPAAELLLWGTPPEAIASRTAGYVDLDFGTGQTINGGVAGRVIYVDPFGNLVTNIPAGLLAEEVRGLTVQAGSTRVSGRRVQAYGDLGRRQVGVMIGSDGLLEIAVREGSAAHRLAAAAGTTVRIRRVTRS